MDHRIFNVRTAVDEAVADTVIESALKFDYGKHFLCRARESTLHSGMPDQQSTNRAPSAPHGVRSPLVVDL